VLDLELQLRAARSTILELQEEVQIQRGIQLELMTTLRLVVLGLVTERALPEEMPFSAFHPEWQGDEIVPAAGLQYATNPPAQDWVSTQALLDALREHNNYLRRSNADLRGQKACLEARIEALERGRA
jgi:hypothetical protein